MRTTIRLDDQLLAEAKQHAAKHGRTLTALFEDALRRFLTIEQRPRSTRPPKLPTYRGSGLHPGIDLDNSSDLIERMDRDHGTY